jgi:hypothetical protein
MQARFVTLVAIAACGGGGGGGDALGRLAKEVPASARIVVALDGARLRDTWIGSAARSLRALVPPDRACVVDAALAADRAVVAELAVGRVVIVATRKRFECGALSQLKPGVWLATLDGAAAPAPHEPRLADRPDFAELRTHLTAPLAAVAPDGDPASGVVFGTAAATDAAHAAVVVQLADPAGAEAAERWIQARLAAAKAIADVAPLVDGVTVTRDGRVVTATLATTPAIAARGGPAAVIAAVTGLADKRAAPVSTAPRCESTRWSIECHDGTRYAFGRSLRATIEAALRAASPTPRVEGGQPAGVRLGEIAPDTVLYALGLRTGDAVIAIDDRRLDTRESLDDAVARLRHADACSITVERGARTFELSYAVQ